LLKLWQGRTLLCDLPKPSKGTPLRCGHDD
jgi:hypothetical protein